MANNVVQGVTFSQALGIVFVTLKLCGVITWSWWLVLLPLYWPLLALIPLGFLALLIGLGWLLYKLFDKLTGKKRTLDNTL